MDNQQIDLNEQLALPDMPQTKRFIPNDMIRSSLFTVSNHNRSREYLKQHVLYSFSNTNITYTGEELRQDDEDVWLQLIYLASKRKNTMVAFRPYTFISQLGWPQRPQYKTRLKNSLVRMSATDLTISNTQHKEGLDFSLVRKFSWSEAGAPLKEWHIWLEPEIVKLFGRLGQTHSKIHWEQRSKLKPLAKWLHSFYSSHAEPMPILATKLKQLSGSKMKTLRHFKPTLRSALMELHKIGFLSDFYIDMRNNVYVTRIKPQPIIWETDDRN